MAGRWAGVLAIRARARTVQWAIDMRHHTLLALAALSLAACTDPLALRVEVTGTRELEPREDGLAPIALEVSPEDDALEVAYSNGWNLALVTLDRTSERAPSTRWEGMLPRGALGMARLGERQHAVLGEGLGYHFDERAGSWRELFCLVPGAAEGEWPLALDQRSRALAHDPITGTIWAQPRTFRNLDEPVRSEIAAWDDESGEELGWWTIDTAFEATAMAVLPDGILVLADWRALHAFDPGTGAMSEIATLDELDVVGVRSMVWDPVDERVLALDMPSGDVISLSISR